MATQTYKSWSVVTASTTAFTVCFMVWLMFAVIGVRSSAFMLMFGVVWVSLMWMYFSEVRPLSAAHSRTHPEPTHFS